MKKNKKTISEIPGIEQLEVELAREKHRRRYKSVFRSTINTLLVVAACAVLVAVLFLPVLKIYGRSMEPTLSEGDIVISVKGADFEPGDLVSFYVGNKLLVKRFIAGPGQWVDIDNDGNVYVDQKLLHEPYIEKKDIGDCNIKLPYQVPENRIFVLGDHRATSIDSRNIAVGSVTDEQVVGKIMFRVWPFSKFGEVR